jgi:hypothetical protein
MNMYMYMYMYMYIYIHTYMQPCHYQRARMYPCVYERNIIFARLASVHKHGAVRARNRCFSHLEYYKMDMRDSQGSPMLLSLWPFSPLTSLCAPPATAQNFKYSSFELLREPVSYLD